MDKRQDLKTWVGSRSSTVYLDAQGNRTEDPAKAVRGEVVEYDEQGTPVRRTWFFTEQVELKWLPVSEPAFLLWVLALLLGAWLVIGVALGLL